MPLRMIVGVVEIHLRLEGCFSLKDKRRVLRSLMDRSRREFQLSMTEASDYDLWNVATIGAAYATNQAHHAQRVLSKVVDFIESHPEVELEGCSTWIERYGT